MTVRALFGAILVAGASVPLSGCVFSSSGPSGPSSIAVDTARNQIWLVDSGRIYLCSANGKELTCVEAWTNIPRYSASK
jgi:hypothetical protein